MVSLPRYLLARHDLPECLPTDPMMIAGKTQ